MGKMRRECESLLSSSINRNTARSERFKLTAALCQTRVSLPTSKVLIDRKFDVKTDWKHFKTNSDNSHFPS